MELTMTAPLSQDLRGRIVRCVAAGTSARAAAQRFEVSASAAIKLVQRVRETGSTAPAKIGGYRRPILEPHSDTLREIAKSKPGITLKEMREALRERGISVSLCGPRGCPSQPPGRASTQAPAPARCRPG